MTARNRGRWGSDEARRWVRSLHLGNPYAKAILMAVANYVNDDGTAYPGLSTLENDTEIAGDTIVNRLRWCDSIGAIVFSKCWLDANGVRNKEGRGRVTSSEIRFLLEADVDAINAAAAQGLKPKALRGAAKVSHEEKAPGRDTEVCCRPDGEQISEVSPPIAVELPPPPAARILEEEDSPPTPPFGVDLKKIEDEKEFEADWTDFRSGYPDGIVDEAAARAELRKLPHVERRKEIDGEPIYAERCRRRREKSIKAHLFIRKRTGTSLLGNAGTAQQSGPALTLVDSRSREGRAILALGRVGQYSPRITPQGLVAYRGTITPRILAFADLPASSEWHVHKRGSQQFWSWWNLIAKEVFVGCNLRELAEITAPYEWPPRVDGTVGPQSTDPPDRPMMTDEDERYLSENAL